MPLRLIRILIWTAFAVAAVVVVYYSLRPGPSLAIFMWRDKIQHFGAYGTLALLAGLGSRSRREGLLWAAGLAVMGYVVELIQPLAGRSYDLLDEAVNIAGCMTGFLLSQLIRWCLARVSRPA